MRDLIRFLQAKGSSQTKILYKIVSDFGYEYTVCKQVAGAQTSRTSEKDMASYKIK